MGMRRRATVSRWAMVGFAVVLSQACGSSIVPRSTAPSPRAEEAKTERVRVLHSYLLDRLRDLESRSARLHAALDSIRSGNIDVLIGTPEVLAAAAPLLGWQMAPPRVGEFAAMLDNQSGKLQTLIVRVDLQRLAQLSRSRTAYMLAWFSRRRQRAQLDRLVDAVLIHEVWGHLVPVALAGTISARCSDPEPGEAELDSCVMLRENELRREMGLPARRHYAVDAR
jgi:hypothetical protein